MCVSVGAHTHSKKKAVEVITSSGGTTPQILSTAMLPQFLGRTKQAQHNPFTVVVVHTFDHYGVYAPRHDLYDSNEQHHNEYYDVCHECGHSSALEYHVPFVADYDYDDPIYEPFIPPSPVESERTELTTAPRPFTPSSRGIQQENARGTFFGGGAQKGNSKLMSWIKGVFAGRKSRRRPRDPHPGSSAPTPSYSSSHGRVVRRHTVLNTHCNPHSHNSRHRPPTPVRPSTSHSHHAATSTGGGHRTAQFRGQYTHHTENDRRYY